MVKNIFMSVAFSLAWIGKKTGLTYNEVNILVYYFIIPLSWAVMIDFVVGMPITIIFLLLIWLNIFIINCNNFTEWCNRIFKDSVDFLNWFNRLGGNYILNSVIICVVIPLVIYGILIWLLIK